MSKNILFSVLGVILGFSIGFFIVNSVTRPNAQQPVQSRAAASGVAGPLKPDEMADDLPPGHPDIGGAANESTGGASSTAASTSAEAQDAMDKADRTPKDFKAQLDAGQVFWQHKDYEKATLYLNRALAIKSNDFDALVLMGNAKYDSNDLTAAASYYERALAVKPDSPDVRTDLGNTYFIRKDYDRAIAEYRKSVAIDPAHLNSWKNIATAAIAKGDKAAAAEAVEKLSTLAPQEADALRQRLDAMP